MTVFRRDAFSGRAAPTSPLSDDAQAITQALFVDARATDSADLLDAARPGQAAFLIDPRQDGLRQVAHILDAHGLGGLSAVDLVGHGGSESLAFGSTALNDASLSNHAADLALIGQALSSRGDLSLYGAASSHAGTGLEFVSDLTPAAGHAVAPDLSVSVAVAPTAHAPTFHAETALPGHGVAPAIQPVGSTPQSAAVAGDADIFILSGAGTSFDALQSVSDTGTYPGTATTFFSTANGNEPSALNNNVARVALDPQNNDYFIEVANTGENKLVVGSLNGLSSTATEGLNTIYSDNAPNETIDGGMEAAFITGIALDPVGKQVYFTEGDQIKQVAYGGGAATVLGTASGTANALDSLALDLTDHTAYFDGKQEVITTAKTAGGGFKTPGGGVTHNSGTNGYYTTTIVNQIWKDSNTAASGQTLSKLPLTGLAGAIEDIAIDPAHQFLYITTQAVSGSAAGVYKYALNNNTTGAVTTVYQESGGITGAFGDIVVDAQGKYYLTVNNGLSAGDVYVGSTGGGTPTLLYAIPTTLNSNGNDTQPVDVAVDLAPTLTLGAVTTVEPIQGGAAIQVLTTAPTAGDPDGNGYLEGATISLGASYKSGDTLSVTLPPGVTVVSNASGVLTLAGNASYAFYQQALESVTYQDGGTDGTAHPTRTLTFTVTDGLVSSTAGTANLTLDHAPNVAAHTVPLLEAASVGPAPTGDTDTDGDTLTAIALNGGTVGTALASAYGVLTLNSNDSYSYSASNTAAIDAAAIGSHPVDSFTYTVSDGHGAAAIETLSFTIDRKPTVAVHAVSLVEGAGTGPMSSSDADPDGDVLTVTALSGGTVGTPLAGSYGTLTLNSNDSYSYVASNTAAIDAAAIGSHPVDSFTYTVSDGLGGTTSETLNFTIDRAPILSAVAGSVNFTEGASAVSLAPAATVSEPDGDPIASASVTIAAGLLAADVLSVDTSGTTIAASFSGGVLTLTGPDTAADYQQVLDSLTFATPVETAATYVAGDGARTLAYSLNDGTLNAVGSETINVSVVFADTAANVASLLDTLGGDATVASISITDGQPLAITYADFLTAGPALAKITGAYLLDVTSVTGQAFTGFTRDYDGSGHLTDETQSGFTGRGYASFNETFDSAGRILDKTYDNASGTAVRTVDKTYDINGALVTETIANIRAVGHTSITQVYDAAHTLLFKEVFEISGGEHDYAYAMGQTFASKSGDQTEFAIGGSDTFVIQSGFGHDRINGYSGGNDSFDISTGVFTDFNDLLAHATAHGHHDTLVTYDANDSFLIIGVSLAELAQHSADFHFI